MGTGTVLSPGGSRARDERIVAARLATLTSRGVITIHGRRISGSKATIDHIAVGASGVDHVPSDGVTERVRHEGGHRSSSDASVQWHERRTPVTRLDVDPSKLLEVLRDQPDLDLVRRLVEFVPQELIEAEPTEQIGAERHERTATRTTRRDASRPRTLSTKAGDVALRIPALHQGSFFPSILERRRVDEALYLVVRDLRQRCLSA